MSQHEVVLLLGTNLGNRKENIEEAIKKIESRAGSILNKSKIIETAPVEFVSSNIFCNIALILYTDLMPFSLLKVLKEIEKEMGRESDSKEKGAYQDRIIDIDIVLFGNIVLESKNLEIPHKKHLFERSFSKILLEEIGFKKTKNI